MGVTMVDARVFGELETREYNFMVDTTGRRVLPFWPCRRRKSIIWVSAEVA